MSGGEGLDRPSGQAFIVHSGGFFDYYYAFPKALAKIAVKGDKKVMEQNRESIRPPAIGSGQQVKKGHT